MFVWAPIVAFELCMNLALHILAVGIGVLKVYHGSEVSLARGLQWRKIVTVANYYYARAGGNHR